MMDLSKLSDADLQALSAGDMSKLSDQALQAIAGPQPTPEVPAEDPGMVGATMIAAGRTFDKVGKGMKQLYLSAKGDQKGLDALAAQEADNDKIFSKLEDIRPISTGFGSVLPTLAVPIGAPASTLSLVARSAAASSLPSVLSYGSLKERLSRGAVDALSGGLGAFGGAAIAKALKPVSTVAGASDDVLKAATRVGYKPLPSQLTQNPSLQSLENYLLRSPGSSKSMQAVVDANQKAVNRAASRAMGQSADDVSEATLAAAKGRLGSEFSRLEQMTSPNLGNDFLNALGKIDAENAARGPFRNPSIDSLVNKSLDLAQQGKLDGRAYKQIRSELSSSAQSAFKAGDSTLGQSFKTVRDQLDEAARASLPAAEKKSWDTARKQYQAFKTVTKGNVAEGGNVSPARVASKLRQGGDAFRTGGMSGDLADIGRIGEAFKSMPNPTSGSLIQQMMFGNPVTGVPMALGNKALSSAYLSDIGQAYLTRGLLDVGDGGRLALARSGGLLAIPTARSLLGVE